MTTETEYRALLEQALEVIVANTTGKDALESAIRAELAKPWTHPCKGIPRKGCDYLTPCDMLCNKCGEVHRHHQMVANFDAAPAHAWPGPPTELGWWPTAAGKATSIRVDGAVMLDREMREWTQARHMYLYFSISGWHVMIGQHFCTPSCSSPEEAILDAWNSGEYDDLEKCTAIANEEGRNHDHHPPRPAGAGA